MWIERWNFLMKQLKQQGAFVHPIEVQPVASEQDLRKVESRLGIQLPKKFRQAMQTSSQQVSIYWSLPDEGYLAKRTD